MNWHDLREGYFRFAGLWQQRRHEQELADELEFHLAMKMKAGRSANEAKREFGGFDKWKEVCRDVGRWRLVEEFGRDLVLAVRMLRKSPVFTMVALVTLTLAIGANTAIFSLMHTLMLKDLGVPNAQRLAVLRIQPDENFGYAFSYPLFQAVERRSGPVMQVFAFCDRTLQMRSGGGVDAVPGQLVSGQYFEALGLKPQLGRWIEPHDDRPGAPDGMVAVVSDHFWRARMNGDRQIIGRKVTLNQGFFTVVGVMPKGFRGMNRDSAPEVFVPFQLEPFVDAPYNSIASGYGSWWFSVGVHMNDGVSLEQVSAFLRTNSRRVFEEAAPGVKLQFNGHKTQDLYLIAEPGSNGLSYLRVRFRKPLTVLMGLVAMVLLVACLNLATLLTARAASRSREISTRFALGASRARLLRQLLTESLLLAITGTVLGLAASTGLARFLAAMLAPQHNDPGSTPLDVTPDLAVFTFTALVAILATVLTGTLPALRSTGNELQGSLREASATLRGVDRRQLWPRLLLAAEVALSLVLVTGASLLGYSLLKLHEIPAGFDARGLLYLPLDMQKQARKGQALMAAYQELVKGAQRLPGVTAGSLTAIIPLTMNWSTSSVNVPGQPELEVWRNTVGPEYFQAMRTPLLQGREFRWADTDASGKKVILNQAAVKLLFPRGEALGQHLTFDNGKTLAEVTGVVGNAKYTTVKDAPPATVYSPVTQDVTDGLSWTLLIRSAGSPGPLIASARELVHRVIRDIPAPIAFSMEDTLDESLATERLMATLALFFGGLALLMTGIGLYGTLAYATERRTGEIGIRLALGAQPRNVISMVCAENGLIAMLGCVIGIAGSIAASKTIASFLYGVSPRDPFVFGIAALALLGVAAVASLVPAVKASRIDPIAAIRYE